MNKELVNHPQHYGGDTPYEVIKVLEVWLGREGFYNWLLGTIIKYLPRADKKGTQITDFEKVVWYTNYMIDYLKRQANVKGNEDQQPRANGDSTPSPDSRPDFWLAGGISTGGRVGTGVRENLGESGGEGERGGGNAPDTRTRVENSPPAEEDLTFAERNKIITQDQGVPEPLPPSPELTKPNTEKPGYAARDKIPNAGDK